MDPAHSAEASPVSQPSPAGYSAASKRTPSGSSWPPYPSEGFVRAGRPPWERRWGAPPRFAGVGLALIAAFIQLVGSTGMSYHRPGAAAIDYLGYALLVAGPVALIFRRRAPVLVVTVALAATVAYCLAGYPAGPCFFSPTIAVFVAVQEGKRVATWLLVTGSLISYVLVSVVFLHQSTAPIGRSAGIVVWACAVLALAEAVRVGRERAVERYQARSERQRRQVSDERLEIAREIHDVLAHHLSLINVQASVALHLAQQRDRGSESSAEMAAESEVDVDVDAADAETETEAEVALAAIKQASKEALQGLRSTLNVLRQVDEDAPRAPAPSLTRIEELVAAVTATGVTVAHRVVGEESALPSSIDLAAYRIVQEALTNVRRHAGPTSVEIVVSFIRDQLTIEVLDEGPASPGARSGQAGDDIDIAAAPSGGRNGIPGMRERAAALGGELVAEPRPGRGFRVFARLPLAQSDEG